MNRPILVALIAVSTLSGTAHGQNEAALSQATLYSYRLYRGKSYINFDSGAKGLKNTPCSAAFDLGYGNLIVNNHYDWFQVCNPKSRIVDLGKKQWTDFKKLPSSFTEKKPRKPLPLNAPMVVDASAGSKEASPFQQFARVREGHMYLVRVARGRDRIYFMFRVDSLTTSDNCVLSWKKIPLPPDDIEK